MVLITVDALRADHLGCYGYPRNTSPDIDHFAKEGVTFANCFAPGSSTLHSSVGLLTGRYLATDKYGPFWENILDSKFTTLAEYLKSFGYYAIAFLSNGNYRIRRGFEQGFDYFHVYGDECDAKKLTAKVLSTLDRHKKDKPIFVWIHYMDPHIPYYFHKEYFNNFEGDRLYRQNDKTLELKPDNIDTKNYLRGWASKGYIPPKAFHKDKYSLNYYIACYDAEVAYGDFYIGDLFRNIKKDNTIIILTADHGESLGEHNIYFAHGENIYDEVLHIPLIIKDNRYFKGGKIVSRPVSGIDIVPTILNRVNPIWYFFNKNKFDGIDLKSIAENKDARRKYIYSYYPWAFSIRDIDKNVKYTLWKNGPEELYILPDEINNLINDSSPKIDSIKVRLRESLRSWLKTYPVASDPNAKRVYIDEETARNLRNLGYLQ